MISETMDLTVTLKNGKKISAEVEVHYCIDNNYGADADGNRGVSALFIEDVIVDDLTHDDDGNPLTEEETILALQLFEEVAAESIDC